MGTEYKLYEDTRFGELSIDEMSNRLSLNFVNNHNYEGIISSNDMTPEEMAKIFLAGLTVCSYWMDKDDLIILINNHLKEF